MNNRGRNHLIIFLNFFNVPSIIRLKCEGSGIYKKTQINGAVSVNSSCKIPTFCHWFRTGYGQHFQSRNLSVKENIYLSENSLPDFGIGGCFCWRWEAASCRKDIPWKHRLTARSGRREPFRPAALLLFWQLQSFAVTEASAQADRHLCLTWQTQVFEPSEASVWQGRGKRLIANALRL